MYNDIEHRVSLKRRKCSSSSKSEYFERKRPAHETLMVPYHPPKSPFSLVQETTYQDPWRLLVATILLNKTRGRLAVPALRDLLTRYPTPSTLVSDPASLPTLTHLLTPLGLQNRRAAAIRTMSERYLGMCWVYPKELPGIGKYGDDSYRIFCCGQTDVVPQDNKLNLYLDWLKATANRNHKIRSKCMLRELKTT